MSLITFIVTAYCACALCTGHTHGITKSGQPAIASYTVACDKAHLHKIVYLEGFGYRQCTDTGGPKIKGNRLDLYIYSHSKATTHGVKKIKGRWLLKWKR